MKIKQLDSAQDNFQAQLADLLAWEATNDDQLDLAVRNIISSVRRDGDEALIALSNQFDNTDFTDASSFEIPMAVCHDALANLDDQVRAALELAAERIRTYHGHQLAESWTITDDYGSSLGQQVTPLERVGIYVPGGKASYPSSVLMNALPAQVAGVDEIIMVSPTPSGELNPLVMAAAALAGVSRFFAIGGAQAVAALCYGTATVPKVDKIVGPGNRFVAAAKRQVFGRVGLDMIAGPSEILIIADETVSPQWLAADLFAQAEHDELAQSILISPNPEVLSAVQQALNELIDTMPRQAIIRASIEGRGALIQVASLNEAVELANQIAAEHLELAFKNADQWVSKIRHAGAIFVGGYTPEAFGDYCAGPNHVLPTSGTARFSSPLGVYDFQKRSSVINVSADGAKILADCAGLLADHESLSAHALSARLRKEG
ncbi:histidinol dehydrogenase [Umboniibacter marinipuniceus]|nr:histidinol dehydrogenase [Umboniibacter marinipuniceus]